MTEEISSAISSVPTYEPDDENSEIIATEEILSATSSAPAYKPDDEKPEITATEEISSTASSVPTNKSDDEKPEITATEEISSTASSAPTNKYDDEKHEITATEKLVTESMIITPPPVYRTFAPLNIPMYRRRQTLTILVWFLMPWTCLYLSLVLLRCHNWYIVSSFIIYLTWMVFFQKYPRQGGLKVQWLRRLDWWKWFAGKENFLLINMFFI
jgi:hypothetical protein